MQILHTERPLAMIEYVVLVGEDSQCLTTVESWQRQPEIFKDTPEVAERFEALCWCAACKHYQANYWDDIYDMHFCEEDFKNGDPLCEYFHEVRTMNE